MPQALYSFFDEYDFSGKTIIPFNVHNGSRFSGTIESIQELEPDAEVITDGFTVSERDVAEAADDVAEWISGLGYKNADSANAESAAVEENFMDGQTGPAGYRRSWRRYRRLIFSQRQSRAAWSSWITRPMSL